MSEQLRAINDALDGTSFVDALQVDTLPLKILTNSYGKKTVMH
jgi:hypothetical protein